MKWQKKDRSRGTVSPARYLERLLTPGQPRQIGCVEDEFMTYMQWRFPGIWNEFECEFTKTARQS